MKHILLLVIGLFAAVTLKAGFGDQTIARQIIIDQQSQITLVENGNVFCEIVVNETSSPTAKFAATELQKYLSESTGATIPIVSTPGNGITSILVGAGPSLVALGVDSENLPRDSFIIKAVANKIVIVGRDDEVYSPDSVGRPWADYYERATLFGVYDFLERFIGATFLFPSEIGTVIPKHSVLKVPTMDILDRPDNIVRSVSWSAESGEWFDNNDVDLQRRLNTYRLRLQTTYIPNNHGLGRMAYIERFGETHPEYFALKPNGSRSNLLAEHHGGQLCFSSEIQEEIYQDAKAFLTGESAESRNMFHDRYQAYVWDSNAAMPGYFNVMPQDGAMPCQCSECQTLAETSPNWQSDQVWKMTCDIANRLTEEGVPGYVTQMAYGNHGDIPPFDIPDNVLVMVAVNGAWDLNQVEKWQVQKDYVQSWVNKINNKVWLWTYATKYAGANILDVPCSTPEAVGKFYSEIQPEIFGSFMESSSDYATFQFFNWYVFSKKMWDTNIDTDVLLEKTYQAMFSFAAEQMEQFFKRLEEIWLTKIVGNSTLISSGPSTIPPTAHELWNEIYDTQEMSQLNALLVAAEQAVAADPESLKRVKFMRENFYDILKAGREKFSSTQNAVSLLKSKVLKVSNGTVVIDGEVTEQEWDQAEVIYLGGLNGVETQVETKVRVLRDDNNLYIAYECDEPEMQESFYHELSPDDPGIGTNSSVEIFLDPAGTRQGYYQWMINQNGDIADLKVSKEGVDIHDFAWNSDATVTTINRTNGWTLELQIPLAKLGEIDAGNLVANFTRSRILKSNNVPTRYHSWSPFIKEYGDLLSFGSLTFEDNLPSNMITNGDFQSPRNGRFFGEWGTSGQFVSPENDYVSLDSSCFLFGGKSLKIASPGEIRINVSQYIDGIQEGKQYKLTVFIRTEIEDATHGGIFLQFNDGVNTAFPTPVIQSSMPWTAYSTIITAREGAGTREVKCYLSLENYNCKGTAWYDGIRVEELVSLPADYYVALNGSNTAPYDSWGNAATTIQTAVAAASSGSTIWVGDGTYTALPSKTAVIDLYSDSPNKSLSFYGNTNHPERVVLDGKGAQRGLNDKFSAAGQTLDLNGFTFSNCYAGYYGGGVNLEINTSGKATVKNCIFLENRSAERPGGAVSCVRNAGSDFDILFSNCLFSANTAKISAGALYVLGVRSMTMVDCRAVGNFADGVTGSGAFMIYETTANLFGCTFFSNRCDNATTIGGGALGTFQASCALTHCHFEENEAMNGDGGAIYSRGSLFATNCVFRNNRANTSGKNGGAIWVNAYSPQTHLYNCLVVGNQSSHYEGSTLSPAIHGGNGSTGEFVIVNSTIVSNSGGVGVLGNWAVPISPTVEIRNSIIRYNQQADGTTDNYAFLGPCTGKVYNTATAPALETAFDGGGNTLADPKFVSLVGGDFHLQPGSPCIDTGLNQGWMIATKDLDSRPRLDCYSQKVDMGCYEYQKSSYFIIFR